MKEQRKADDVKEMEREQKYNKPFGKNKMMASKAAPPKPEGKMPKWKQ